MYKLKVINLEGSLNLIKTPDFTMAPDLEILVLEGCTRIVKVHPSLGVLKRLKLLNLRGCKSLRSLPTKIGMESLEILILLGCSNLVRFPEMEGKMECLKTLNLSACCKVENFLENLQQVENLEELDLSETSIREPPSFIFQLNNLKVLSFNGCKGPSKLQQNLPSPFKETQIGRTSSMPLMLPSLSSLSSLRELTLRYCNLREGDIPSDIFCLSSLTDLDLSGNNFISIPASLTQLPKLKLLMLTNCKELKSLPELLTSISRVCIDGCASLEVVASPSKVSNLFDLASIKAINCYRLAENIKALTLLKKHLKLPVAFLSMMMLPGISLSTAELLSIVEILDKPVEMDLSFEIQIFDVSMEECDELELSFTDPDVPCVKVKKCGVRMVYEKDLEDIKELHSHATHRSPNLEDVHQHSADNDRSIDSIAYLRKHRYGNWLCMDQVIDVKRRMWEVDSKGKFTEKKVVFSLDSEGMEVF
ncbi:hypothetical protein GOBAR_AA05329 [Gossypium barbadense]|uniref:Uncharacterized protein n=1 Tax=Gossypium barbadense TaxID=3634 RepID=A0A2P5YI27_GOSBA|nr:hypothetical protein GOBAR_AA05329 [Gossypium barbadense]